MDQMCNETCPVEGARFQFCQTNGIRMRYAETGFHGRQNKPTVLLLHGWPESWYSWRAQMLALDRAGFHAVAPDMRGYGSTQAPTSGKTI